MNSFEKLVESLVSAFFSVFSFLPSWSVVFIGSAFAFMVGVIVYKLIRR